MKGHTLFEDDRGDKDCGACAATDRAELAERYPYRPELREYFATKVVGGLIYDHCQDLFARTCTEAAAKRQVGWILEALESTKTEITSAQLANLKACSTERQVTAWLRALFDARDRRASQSADPHAQTVRECTRSHRA